jgi:xanthine dehydrogenase iron-sulfur cluster and FAD-binding subunit A
VVEEGALTNKDQRCDHDQRLARQTPKPSAAQKKQALSGNLCRCGMNIRILRVLKRRRAIGLLLLAGTISVQSQTLTFNDRSP